MASSPSTMARKDQTAAKDQDPGNGLSSSATVMPLMRKDTAAYPALDSATLKEVYEYGSFAQAAYFGTKTVADLSLGMYTLTGTLQKVKAIHFLNDKDDPLRPGGLLTTDTEAFAALMDSGELVFGFRGTEVIPGTGSLKDWATDFYFFLTPISELNGIKGDVAKVRVHTGFLRAFNSLADPEKEPPSFQCDGRPRDLLQMVAKMKREHPTIPITKITCVGHSLGGALATMAAYWCKKVAFPELPVYCYTYGSPRVGNPAFAAAFESIVDKAVRVVHRDDIVPTLPPAVFGFSHVGTPVLLFRPALKDYGLGHQVGRSFRNSSSMRERYIAAYMERPRMGVYVSIPNHFIWYYVSAIASAMGEPPKKSVLSLLWNTSGLFDALTLVQRVLMMDAAPMIEGKK